MICSLVDVPLLRVGERFITEESCPVKAERRLEWGTMVVRAPLVALFAVLMGLVPLACGNDYATDSTVPADAGDAFAPEIDGSRLEDAGEDRSAPRSSLDAEPADAGDGLPAHGPNLLSNSDFELGCAGWSGNTAALDSSSVSHRGSGACKVCPTASTGLFLFGVTRNVKAGERYYAEVWVRTVAEDGGVREPELLGMRTNAEVGPASTGSVSRGTYSRLGAFFTPSSDGTSLTFLLTMYECVIADDALLVQLQ